MPADQVIAQIAALDARSQQGLIAREGLRDRADLA